jgi:SAM-dependent methyltransferase
MRPDRTGATGDEPVTSIYRDPYHYELMAQMTAPPDLPFYHELVEAHGGPVLEVACGTGRVSITIARRGVRVVGVDRSLPLLDYARAKADEAGLDVDLRHADMRDFELGRESADPGPFALVLVPYNAFNHLYTLDDVRGCLGSIARHMGPETRFVIDTFNPDPARLHTDPVAPQKILEYLEPLSGQHVRLFEQARYDAATQVNHVTWRYEVDGVADAWVDELPMRIFFPCELDALLVMNGFSIERKLGDYDGTPFGSATPKQLVVCRR